MRICVLLLLIVIIPAIGEAQTPFDISNSTPRPVVVYVDNNFNNPSAVGTNLVEAFTGNWSVSSGVGTVTVAAADSIAAFALSGAPGTPVLPGSWSNLQIEIQISTGQITDLRQTGFVTVPPATPPNFVNRPFAMHLNTTQLDFLNGPYTSSCYDLVSFIGGLIIPIWYSAPAFSCTGLVPGPTRFAYVPSSGRFNAIGPISLDLGQIGIVPVYGTYGDARLLEVDGADVPFGTAAGVALAVLLGAASVANARRRSNA